MKIAFYILAILIAACSVLAVTSRKMLRAATYLLAVLIGTAGLYLLLDYHFLAAVQISVYAGGILVLFIFAILLTSARGDKVDKHDTRRVLSGAGLAVAGLAVTGFITLKHRFLFGAPVTGDAQIDMKTLGSALMGTDKYQYLLPFEAMSVLLLACVIGGILIARRR